MKTKLHTVNTFRSMGIEELKKSVTSKVEKLINQQAKQFSQINFTTLPKKSA